MRNFLYFIILIFVLLILGCEKDKAENPGIAGPDILDNINNYDFALLLTYTCEGYNLIIGPNSSSEIDSLEIIMDNEIIELTSSGDAYYHTFTNPLIGGHNYHFEIEINGTNYPSFYLKMVNIFTDFGVLDSSVEKPKLYWELNSNNMVQEIGGYYITNSQQNNYDLFIEPSQRSYRYPKKDQWLHLFVDEINYNSIDEIAAISGTGFNFTNINGTYAINNITLDYYFDLLKNNRIMELFQKIKK